VQVAAVAKVTKVAGGSSFSTPFFCAVSETKVVCWGYDTSGVTGPGTDGTLITAPQAIVGLPTSITDVTAGEAHACALASTGDVYCWGANEYGQLGLGTSDYNAHPSAASKVALPGAATAIAAAGNAECALVTGGLWCWGSNNSSQLGLGTEDNLPHISPTVVAGFGLGVTGVGVGGPSDACALKSGAAYCWGQKLLSNTAPDTNPTPMLVTGWTSGMTQIAVGQDHVCAVNSAGVVSCWGDNTYGQLGASGASTYTPLSVPRLPALQFVTVGVGTSCALTSAGEAWCWGNAANGALGNSNATTGPTPTTVTDCP
jgi:alpha-tubulin suppressor-like RCC1 family protein